MPHVYIYSRIALGPDYQNVVLLSRFLGQVMLGDWEGHLTMCVVYVFSTQFLTAVCGEYLSLHNNDSSSTPTHVHVTISHYSSYIPIVNGEDCLYVTLYDFLCCSDVFLLSLFLLVPTLVLLPSLPNEELTHSDILCSVTHPIII